MRRKIPLILVGAGDTGLAVLDLLQDDDRYRIVGFLDDLKTGEVNNTPILGTTVLLDRLSPFAVKDIVISITLDVSARERIATTARRAKLNFPSVTHPSSDISLDARLGAGVITFPFSSIRHGASIGEFGLVKSYACVSYHSTVGPFSVLGPYSLVSSHSSIGSRTLLLARSTVSSNCQVGDDCTIRPHSYISSSVPSNSIVWGVPAIHESKSSLSNEIDVVGYE